MAVKPTRIEWICTQCNRRATRGINDGRPLAGTCPKKNGKPHSWAKNRKF